jgi:L-asparaginase II
MTDPAANPLLIAVTRGGITESSHRGRAAVVDAAGRVLVAWGDIKVPIYPRSANKALQALPLVESGAADAFGLGDAELALACASHAGEPMHTQRVASWLARMGLTHEHLECGQHAPYDMRTWEAMLASGEPYSALHNNCSGKHTGMLATALHAGWPLQGYVAYRHHVQQRIIGVIEQMTGQDLSAAPCGIDGCSIPTVALPLEALAYGMARLADPIDLPPARAEAATRLLTAWGRHPELVAGSDQFDTRFMQAIGSRILCKAGAEGVATAIIPAMGIAIAVKIDDGAGRAAGPAMIAVLERLDLLSASEREALASLARPPIINRAGAMVGGHEAAF